MPLATKTLAQFVQDAITAWGASVGISPTFTAGDVLLAMFEAVATQDVFLLAQIQVVLALTRAATSNGPDLDSWIQQFGMTRLPAVTATGTVTFGKNGLANAPIQIPVGTAVQSADGLTQFLVVADTSQSGFNPALGAYVLAAGQSSVNATVQATVAGTAGNAAAGQISQSSDPLAGIDTVTNTAAIQNGQNAETDAAVRLRIPNYFASLRSAIPAAIIFAATSVQQGVRVQLAQNVPQVGFYTLFADDGSGNPPDSFITAVTAAVQAVTAEGVQPVVRRFTPLNVIISVNLNVSATANLQSVEGNVSVALAAYVSALPITPTGMTLPFLELPVVISNADPSAPGIAAGSLTVDGATSDINAPVGSLILAPTITVG